SIKSGSEVNRIKSEISDIDLKLSNVKNEHKQEGQQLLFSLKARLQEEQSNINIQRSELEYLKASSDQNSKRIKDNEELMNKLRNEYIEENQKEFNHESECVCPTCEQDLPQDQVSEIANKFNLKKAKKLEEINEQGKNLKEQNASLNEDVESTQAKIDKTIEQGKQKENEIKRLEEKIQAVESNVKPITENASYNKLMQERQALEQQIETLQHSVEESVQQVQIEIQSLKEKQSGLQADQSKLNQLEQSQKRVQDLEEQEKKLASEFEEM